MADLCGNHDVYREHVVIDVDGKAPTKFIRRHLDALQSEPVPSLIGFGRFNRTAVENMVS